MANHVTQAERDELRRTAENYTVLAGDGSIVDFDASARRLAGDTGVSFERARGAIAYVARRRRSPDYEPPGPGRPVVMDNGTPVTVYLPQYQIDAATRLGSGNLSEGIRIALAVQFDR